MSYGLCEAAFGQLLGKNLAGALNVIFEQQAVQGQTVVISSGDTGSEGCLRVDTSQPGLLSAEFPGSDPFVLSVGGTSILSSDPVARNAEVVWNDSPDPGWRRRRRRVRILHRTVLPEGLRRLRWQHPWGARRVG